MTRVRYEDIRTGRINVSRIEERVGWLGVNQRDPGADPPADAWLDEPEEEAAR